MQWKKKINERKEKEDVCERLRKEVIKDSWKEMSEESKLGSFKEKKRKPLN